MTKSDLITEEGAREDDGLFVASLAKGFRVLESFDGGRTELSFAEIVERSGIGKSAAQRAVSTLVTLRYLIKDDVKRTYRISHRFLALTRKFSSGSSLIELGLPEATRLHDETGETINISERDDTDMVIVARLPGRHVVTISIDVGTRLPAYATAPGLVILANEPADIISNVLSRTKKIAFTKNTITKTADIRACLDKIVDEGFFIGNQLRYDGEFSLAAPVFGYDNIVLGAINVSVPVSRWTEDRLRTDLAPLVVEAAQNITKAISER